MPSILRRRRNIHLRLRILQLLLGIIPGHPLPNHRLLPKHFVAALYPALQQFFVFFVGICPQGLVGVFRCLLGGEGIILEMVLNTDAMLREFLIQRQRLLDELLLLRCLRLDLQWFRLFRLLGLLAQLATGLLGLQLLLFLLVLEVLGWQEELLLFLVAWLRDVVL